jgi:hypothetical protein
MDLMRIASILAVWALVLVLVPAAMGQQWAEAMFEHKTHDFGSVGRGAKAEHEFVLKNPYLEDVVIASVSTSCGCTTPTIEKRVLKTYESGSIKARFNSDRFLGKKGATLTVRFSKPLRASVRLRVDGSIHSDLIVNPSSANLGEVDRGTAAERRITVRYAGRQDLRIVDVKSTNPHVKAQIVPSSVQRASYELIVQLDDQAPSGYIRDNLLLMTNHYQLKQIPVLVEGRVMPEVTVNPSTLFLGSLKPGDSVTKNVVIMRSDKRPFAIKSLRTEHEGISFGASDMETAKPIHIIPVTITAGTEPGALVETIVIETDGSTEMPELNTYAVVQP